MTSTVEFSEMEYKVCIATCRAAFKDWRYTDGFRALTSQLKTLGVTVVTDIWSDPDVCWREYDLILVIGITDYVERYEAFCGWLARAEAGGWPVYNPPAAVRWNMNKRYLLELERLGVAIPRTVVLERREGARRDEKGRQGVDLEEQSPVPLGEELIAVLKTEGWDEAVIKPAVGRDGQGILKVTPETSGDAATVCHLEKLLTTGDVLLQEFIPSVHDVTAAEVCCYFFGGTYDDSCIIKHPACPGVIGGGMRISSHVPTATAVNTAKKIYDVTRKLLLPVGNFLYARIDMIPDAITGSLLLNEVEIMEPVLNFEGKTREAALLAREVLEILRK